MDKSPEAFRTISEVAESLETPAHVLRFWESRFPQIKPVKRAGGRRYYRPADVALLGGIRHLLHDEGMTIRGVQKILREQGVRHVAALAAGSEGIDFEADLLDSEEDTFTLAEAETAQVVALEPVARAPAPLQPVPGEVVQLRAAPEPAQPEQIRPAPPREEVPEEVPEAGHIWVEDEPEMELESPAVLFPKAPDTGLPPLAMAGAAEFANSQGRLPDDLSEGFVVRGAITASRPVTPQNALPTPEEALAPEGIADSVTAVMVSDAPFIPEHPERAALQLSGIAARLRALPQPISPEAAAELLELHSRLGLLHAQIAEAQRLRR